MPRTSSELPTRIETQRLYLRRYEQGDGEWYCAAGHRNRKHLARYESGNALRTIETVEDAEQVVRQFRAEWEAGSYYFFGAFDRAGDEFVAQITVGPVSGDLPEFEVGYVVDCDHEGQGFVTEAVRGVLGWIMTYLHAHRVRIECDDTNVRSYRVAERCGFVREAHFRENKKHADGSISGTLFYGLLRREFEALQHPDDHSASR